MPFILAPVIGCGDVPHCFSVLGEEVRAGCGEGDVSVWPKPTLTEIPRPQAPEDLGLVVDREGSDAAHQVAEAVGAIVSSTGAGGTVHRDTERVRAIEGGDLLQFDKRIRLEQTNTVSSLVRSPPGTRGVGTMTGGGDTEMEPVGIPRPDPPGN